MNKFIFICIVIFIHGEIGATSLTLNELISLAIGSHPSLLSKESSKKAAEEELLASKLQFLPTPSVNTLRNRVTYDNQSNTGNLPSTTVTINQPLLIDGGIINGYKKSQANLKASEYGLIETRDEIAIKIITAYSEWLKNHHKIKVYQSGVQEHEKFLKLVTNRYESGISSGNDGDLVLSRLSQTRSELLAIEFAEKNALNSLSQLIGRALSRDEIDSNYRKKSSLEREEVISLVQQNNPTLKRLKSESEAAEAYAKQALAQSFPQLSIQAQRQIGNPYTPGWPSYSSVGFNLAYAPGSGLSSFAIANAAFSKATATVLMLESTKRDLNEKISSELNDYESSVKRLKNLQESSTYQKKISESFERQFEVSKKNWLDLLNSIRERLQVDSALVDVEMNVFSTSHRLHIYMHGVEL